jgi:hypothetical protein
MQLRAFAGVAADTSYTATELGYDPDDYTNHTVSVDTTAGDTFEVLVRQKGSTAYRSINKASLADGRLCEVMPKLGKVTGIRVEFTGGSVAAANVEITSFSLAGSQEE